MSEKVLVVYRVRAEADSYAAAVELAGAEPVLREAMPGLEIGTCRGLLLTGGGDVDPQLYGETATRRPSRRMRIAMPWKAV